MADETFRPDLDSGLRPFDPDAVGGIDEWKAPPPSWEDRAKRLSFSRYLRQQRHRNDPVGSVARDLLQDEKARPAIDDPTRLMSFLIVAGATASVIAAGKQMLKEWARERRMDINY